MRAVRVHELIGPSGVRLDEGLPSPKVGSSDVCIQVRAAGINFPDVLLSYGKYQFKPTPPFSPGGEVAGVVQAVGDSVKSVRVGDRVASTMIHGGLAEEVVVDEAAVMRLPDSVGFEAGAGTLLTHGTTMHALVDRAQIKSGETLLVLGAAGGVGTAAIDLGKKLGVRVIAAASTDAKLAYCKARGADEVICYGREDLKQRVKTLTDGRGVDVVYDAIGGDLAEQALRATAWQGRYLVVGFASGTIPKIPLNLVLLKGCSIVGVFWGQFAMTDTAKNRANTQQVLAWIADGSLPSTVQEVARFADAADVLGRMERREIVGKVVLTP